MNSGTNPFGEHRGVTPDSPGVGGAAVDRTKLRTSTKTFAIVLLVLGGMAVMNSILVPLLGALGVAVMSAAGDAGKGDSQYEQVMLQLNGIFSPLSLGLLAVTFLVGLGLVIGGIGTLQRRRWAARLLRWCAGIMVIATLGQTANGMVYQWINKDAQMQQWEERFRNQGNPLPDGFENVAEIIFIAQIGFTAVIALIFASIYLWAYLHLSQSTTMEQFPTSLNRGARER